MQLVREDPDAAVFFILLLHARLHPSSHTPYGLIPVYEKPALHKRGKKPEYPEEHEGARRPSPPRIDQRTTHTLETCPDCNGQLNSCTGQHDRRTRLVEDLPLELKPVVTDHTLVRAYCPACKKVVKPRLPDALPGRQIGNRVLTLSAFWHYGLGLPISQIVLVLSSHLHFSLSEGGLAQMGQRLAEILQPWYEELGGPSAERGGTQCG